MKNSLQELLIGLGVLLSVGLPAIAGPQPTLEARYAAHPLPSISTAGQITPADVATLRHHGYAAIINLRTEGESGNWDARAVAEEAGLRYFTLPIGSGDITADKARELDELIAKAGASAETPVLVHCASSNRVGALLALRAALFHGSSPEEALELGRAAGLKSLEDQVRAALPALPSDP